VSLRLVTMIPLIKPKSVVLLVRSRMLFTTGTCAGVIRCSSHSTLGTVDGTRLDEVARRRADREALERELRTPAREGTHAGEAMVISSWVSKQNHDVRDRKSRECFRPPHQRRPHKPFLLETTGRRGSTPAYLNAFSADTESLPGRLTNHRSGGHTSHLHGRTGTGCRVPPTERIRNLEHCSYTPVV